MRPGTTLGASTLGVTLATALVSLVATTGALEPVRLAVAAPPEEPVEAILCRGASAEGFSYAWGGECWCGAACSPDLASCEPGLCTADPGGSGCPDCTHEGAYGADCSGFVSKVWQVPSPFALEACGVDRFTAAAFTEDHDYWTVVSMDELEPGDAVASQTHVILVLGDEDPHGEREVVEAKGCSYGVVRHSRSFSSTYGGARRVSLATCTCGPEAPGSPTHEARACGDCGTQERSCDGCMWTAWSPCEGPHPTGPDARCPLDGAGACALGERRCLGGYLSCVSPVASAELCNGVDDDCNGVVDDGTDATLGEGYPCVPEPGAGCAQGTLGSSACVDGELRCVPPSPCAAADATPIATGCACSLDAREPSGRARGAMWLVAWAAVALGRRRARHGARPMPREVQPKTHA